MTRILLDQGLAPRAAKLLRAEGWEALHVGDAGLDRADDSDILEFARQRGMACVTLDHDFHTHLALALSTSPSVIMLRIEGLTAEGQVALIKAVWAACGEAIAEGAAVSTDGVAVRFRRLPLR
jgi:predicted nuclease of predicted toxin-antitoxin system